MSIAALSAAFILDTIKVRNAVVVHTEQNNNIRIISTEESSKIMSKLFNAIAI